MNERDFKTNLWVRSIIGFIVGGIWIGLMMIFFISVFSFIFLTPFFTLKYLGEIHLLKIILIFFGFVIVIGALGTLKDILKKKINKLRE